LNLRVAKLLLCAVAFSGAARPGWAANPRPQAQANQSTTSVNRAKGSPAAQKKHWPADVINEDKIYSLAYLKAAVKKESLAIAADPKNYRAYRWRGLAYWKMEDFQRARIDLEKAASLVPKMTDADVYRALGECYAQDDLQSKAIDSYTKAIQISPNYIMYFLRRAQSYAAIKDYARAIQDADHLVLSMPSKPWVFDFRARLYSSAGRYQKVVEDCTASIKLDPTSCDTYSIRMKAYEKLGKHDLADKDKKRITELTKAAYPF
jgi:tetratricopeptide (TPR) repeat protein